MKTTQLLVQGPNIFTLREKLETVLGHKATVMTDNVAVLGTEKFYLRIGSNLMSVVVLINISPMEARLIIITGGAKYGILSISWGAEGSNHGKILNEIKTIANAHAWQLQEIQSPT